MKTFKVTFFDKELDVFNVLTYHNVINQSAMMENIAILIDTLDLHTAVKADQGVGTPPTPIILTI